METEKTSYTLNHNGDDHDESKTESYEPLEDEVAVETDKMLAKENPELKKSADNLKDADESKAKALEEKSEAVKEKETPNVPTKNRFMQYFQRKPTEPANGNAAPESVDGAATTTTPKRKLISIKLQNPFAKKSETATPPSNPEKTTNEATSSDDKKGSSS